VEIRFKDGGPLLVGGAMVAGSQTCCCENPPPPVCWCPDYCQYKIEIVSPQECRASSTYGCESASVTNYTEPSLIQSVLDPFTGVIDCPGETSGAGGAPCGNYGQAYMSNAFMESGLFANAYSAIAKRREVGFSAGAIADAGFQARVFCLMPTTTGAAKPQIFLQLDLRARVSNNDSSLGEVFLYSRVARKTLRIENENCEAAGDRKCLYLNDTNRRIANFQTPLEFTLSLATTSLGDYDEDVLSGREFGPYEDVLASLVDAGFEATFRITSRPSCVTVPADCDVPIGEGNTTVLWGGTSLDFVLGTAQAISRDDPVTGDLLFYEHQGGIGTLINPYKFFYDRSDSTNTTILERQYLDLYCLTDNNVSPPTTAWYVVHQTFKYCGGFTLDQWAGTIDTYAAPENCLNISAGDPVPIGEPTMERSSGYPQDSAGGCGDPAPRILFELKAPCSG
jgi:hypothetical protein